MLDLKMNAGSAILSRPLLAAGPPPSPPPPPPRWSVAPRIVGTPTVGVTLTLDEGTIVGGSVTARSWQRGGVAIAGATQATYTAGAADADALIDVVLTAGGPGGVTQATTAAVGPVATAAPARIERIVIEGDSITSTTPDQPSYHGDFYSYAWKAAHPALTVSVPAQASRTVGGPGDAGSPAGNTLLDARAADLATGPQLLTVMIGANDLGSFTPAETLAKLEAWASPIREAGVRIAIAPPTPYRDFAPRLANFAIYTERRAAYVALLRDPAVWSRFADAYIPMGEHPDFADPALIPALYGDGAHPSAPVADGGTGQARLHAVFAAAMTSLIDPARRTATAPYGSVWPVDEANLPAGQALTRRFLLSGLGDAGVASGLATSGGAAEMRVNGGAWGTTSGHVYNGDVIDIRVTSAATAGAAVTYDLRIGTESRSITLRTVAAVTPVVYRHGGISSFQPTSAVSIATDVSFASGGIAVLALKAGGSGPIAITVGGIAATRRFTQSGEGYMDLWTAPVDGAGTATIELAGGGPQGLTTLSWGVVEHADPAPTQVDIGMPLHQSPPHPTSALTVPSRGLAIAFLGEYGGASMVPASTHAGTTFVNEGNGMYQGERQGLCVGIRSESGVASFDFAFGTHPRGAIVFKAAGS